MFRYCQKTGRSNGEIEKKAIARYKWEKEYAKLTHFQHQVLAYIGLDVPDEAETDFEVNSVLQVFYYASRSRHYTSGTSVIPLPLSVRQISDVVEVHTCMLDRATLDECVFALDDIWLAEQYATNGQEK